MALGPISDLGAVFQAMEKKTPLQQLEEWRQKERDRERERERLPDANPIEPLQQVCGPLLRGSALPCGQSLRVRVDASHELGFSRKLLTAVHP